MATRFEPTRDDNGLWSLAAACNVFPEVGRSERQVSMSPAVNSRYPVEVSDDERRTSSCSPQSCDHNKRGIISHSDTAHTHIGHDMLSSRFPSVETQKTPHPLYQNPMRFCSLDDVSSRYLKEQPSSNLLRDQSFDIPKILDLSKRPSTSSCNLNQLQGSIHENNVKRSTCSQSTADASATLNHPPKLQVRTSAIDWHQYDSPPDYGIDMSARSILQYPNKNQNGDSISNVQSGRKADFRSMRNNPSESDSGSWKTETNSSVNHVNTVARRIHTDSERLVLLASEEKKEGNTAFDKFEESEAVEALLGLSEGIYPSCSSFASKESSSLEVKVDCVTSSTSTSSSQLQDQLYQESDQPAAHELVIQVNPTNNEPRNDESSAQHVIRDDVIIRVNGESECGTVNSRFHFKKRICRKFAESLDQPKDDSAPESNAASAAEIDQSTRAIIKNGDEPSTSNDTNIPSPLFNDVNAKQRSSSPVDNETQVIRDEEASESCDEKITFHVEKRKKQKKNHLKESHKYMKSSKQKRKSEVVTSQSENKRKRLLSPKQSSSKISKEHKKMKQSDPFTKNNSDEPSRLSNSSHDDFSTLRLDHHKTSIFRDNMDANGDSKKRNARSNLYRLTSSLGSSSESLVAYDDAEDDFASESSSECSSESEDDSAISDENLSFSDVMNSDVVTEQSNSSNATAKRKAFVLSKPKFSLPNKEKQLCDKTMASMPSCQKSLGKGTRFGEVGAILSTNRPNALSNTLFVTPANDEDQLFSGATKDVESQCSSVAPKSNGFLLKKATFTFCSADKQECSLKTNTLTMSSQCNFSVDSARQSSLEERLIHFDQDVSNKNATIKGDLSKNDEMSRNGSDKRLLFETFRGGASFETLSKPGENLNNNQEDDGDTNEEHSTQLSYDKHRLPRSTARSAALEAQQDKTKVSGKRAVVSEENWAKKPKKIRTNLLLKRCKIENTSERRNKRFPKSDADELKISSGESIPEVRNDASGRKPAPLSSSSRRKPARVFKHQKYSTLKIKPSLNNGGDERIASEFALLSKPLGLEHRELLSKSFEPQRHSSECWSEDSVGSTASTAGSSRPSSLADGDYDVAEKSVNLRKRHLKRHRHVTATESCVKKKPKMRRLFSESDRHTRCRSTSTDQKQVNGRFNIREPAYRRDSGFKLLSLFPAPASLRAGHALGELCPGYGATVSGHRLPLRWSKGMNVADLKQKRQRDKWRNLSLDMFCMGGGTTLR